MAFVKQPVVILGPYEALFYCAFIVSSTMQDDKECVVALCPPILAAVKPHSICLRMTRSFEDCPIHL